MVDVPRRHAHLDRARARADDARPERHAGDAGVLLISDLNDSIFDVPQLTQTLTQYVGDKIPLRVIGLNREPREQGHLPRG